MVQFVSVSKILDLVNKQGIETVLKGMTEYVEEDYRRWELFDKTPRVASHSKVGVIELMPTSDGELYSFKYVNGHPKNTKEGKQTVTAFGMLADVDTGYPFFLSEMTVLTALRTAATSAMAARHLARPNSSTMAIIGNGAQSEFQALAFKAVMGITTLRLFDVDGEASEKCATNLSDRGFNITICRSSEEAIAGADIITTVTADKQAATILTDNMVGAGVHINAIGGDCPGKTELHKDILLRSKIFVEYPEQTRIEGEIQQLDADHPVTELWEVITGAVEGRSPERDITLFDSVGFAIEDFSGLRYIYDLVKQDEDVQDLEMIAEPADPRNLFGLLGVKQAAE
ncbi:ornithine cyclodeaminase [Pseudovibrio sp. Tun.PSC04-5.I4]|uniref:ornithine cyclodeaminase n=1 Tax=Pseudovibrio sp. Tun.PSC04-5.I4 TaxID=1798213 RepID=UPI000889F572|nr:ornithine cyclodeaminase [Pseudovibrio sp. Tun.PSC04-5.I4]SDR22318.1 ornithine cyclodeaminase [Pseudovibrio sp. Tun.PSC04-5.I4]